MSFFDLTTASTEPAFAELPDAQREAIVHAINARRPMRGCLATAIGAPAFIMTFVVGIIVLRVLEKWMQPQGPQHPCFTALLMLCLAGFVWSATAVAFLRWRIRRDIERHLRTPLCVWCGYTLTGLRRNPEQPQSIVCPECGRASLAAQHGA